MNRAQADYAKHFTAVDYALALSGVAQYRRAMHSWWHEGWDLLLTPTLGELPLKLGTIVNDPENPMSPMRRAANSCRSLPRSTPAANRRSASRWSGRPRACRSACSSSRPMGAKTS